MNRRNFLKITAVVSIVGSQNVIPDEPNKEDSLSGLNTHGHSGNWPYRVYCYERGQGEWTFSKNIKGSFASEREYMTFREEPNGYLGFMYDGVLHFQTLDDASDFVDMHVRAKDDTNIIDTIYDVYYTDRNNLEYESAQPTELHVAHYWFNGDTGRQIFWEHKKDHTNWHKVETG